MSRPSLIAVVVAFTLAAVPAHAQTLKRPVAPVAQVQVPQANPIPARDTTHGAGSGLTTVWISSAAGSPVYVGTARVSWSTNGGAEQATPTQRMPGVMFVWLGPNNTLSQTSVYQTCVATNNCPGGANLTITNYGQYGASIYSVTGGQQMVLSPPTLLVISYQNVMAAGGGLYINPAAR